MLKVVHFEPFHCSLINLREHERRIALVNPEVYTTLLSAASHVKRVMTLVQDNIIMGFIGYHEFWKGSYEVWIIPAKEVFKSKITFLRTVKFYLEEFIRVEKPKRVQITALADATHDRWCEWLGFEKEGTMRNFAPTGETYNLWARVA